MKQVPYKNCTNCKYFNTWETYVLLTLFHGSNTMTNGLMHTVLHHGTTPNLPRLYLNSKRTNVYDFFLVYFSLFSDLVSEESPYFSHYLFMLCGLNRWWDPIPFKIVIAVPRFVRDGVSLLMTRGDSHDGIEPTNHERASQYILLLKSIAKGELHPTQQLSMFLCAITHYHKHFSESNMITLNQFVWKTQK